MKTVAVIPAYREAGRIGKTVAAVVPYVGCVVVVDDGSPDTTASEAREAGAHVLRHCINRGQGAALRTGTIAAIRLGAETVLHVDADGQHDPASIPALLRPLHEKRSDVVFGSRFLGSDPEGMPWTRGFLLRAARVFNTFIVGVPRRVTDPQSGYRAFTAQASAQIIFRQDRMAHCSEILRLVTRSSLRWQEVPVQVRYSADSLRKGQKPWNAFRIVWELFLGLFTP